MARATSAPAAPVSGGDRRGGILAGLGAYGLWGVFPVVFRLVDDVAAFEILLHRIVWSFVVVLAVLALAGRLRELALALRHRRSLRLLATAAVLVSVNWLGYIWAVNNGHVVEAALGYYVNPLITVALGVVVLGERLRRTQHAALALGAAAVAVLTVSYGRPPWIALLLACSFAGYGFVKNRVEVNAVPSLAVETLVLLPAGVGGLVWLQVAGTAAFTHGPVGRDAVLVSLGVVTAVPLVLFATAARRIPLSLLGLLQYLTPTLQFLCGVLLFDEQLPTARLAGFVLVWGALVVLSTDLVRTVRAERRAARRVLAVTAT